MNDEEQIARPIAVWAIVAPMGEQYARTRDVVVEFVVVIRVFSRVPDYLFAISGRCRD